MKGYVAGVLLALSFSVAAADTVQAGDETQKDYLVAKQGKAEVWAIDVDAHLASMPETQRAEFINSPKRIQQLLSHLLLRRNLAIEAQELGLDQDAVTQREIEQAKEVILMRRRLDYLREHTEVPDLQELAHEKFIANPDVFKSRDLVSVAHILLNTDERTAEEAQAQLKRWKADIAAGKASVEALAAVNSDDPGAAANKGLYSDYDVNNFVPEFRDAVNRLQNPGDLSDPVKTQFGYHLIQLRERKAGKPYTWDEVKDRLLQEEEANYVRKQQQAEIERLRSLPVEASEDSVAPLRERYGSLDHSEANNPDALLPESGKK